MGREKHADPIGPWALRPRPLRVIGALPSRYVYVHTPAGTGRRATLCTHVEDGAEEQEGVPSIDSCVPEYFHHHWPFCPSPLLALCSFTSSHPRPTAIFSFFCVAIVRRPFDHGQLLRGPWSTPSFELYLSLFLLDVSFLAGSGSPNTHARVSQKEEIRGNRISPPRTRRSFS